LISQQAFVEIWRIPLHSPTVERALVLADTKWRATDLIQINKSYSDGRWRLELRRKMQDTSGTLGFDENKLYTFGLALNGADNHAGSHWVSLPMTLSFGGNNSDFTAE
jgi:hypothetical protein